MTRSRKKPNQLGKYENKTKKGVNESIADEVPIEDARNFDKTSLQTFQTPDNLLRTPPTNACSLF